jgi:hypothetical protein
MIRQMSRSEAPAASTLAWAQCGKMKNRSFPLYASQPLLLREFENCAARGDLLGYFEGECLTGVLSRLAIPADRYLQTTGLYTDSSDPETVLDALLGELERGQEAMEKYIGVTAENTAASAVLTRRGYQISETAQEYRAEIEAFHAAGDPDGTARVSRENWPAYAAFHDRTYPDIYWTAERLLADLDNWAVYAEIRDGAIVGSLAAKLCGKSGNRELAEIFAWSAPEERTARSLLAAFADDLRDAPDVRQVSYFYDGSEPWGENILTDAGFTLRSRYRCWKK